MLNSNDQLLQSLIQPGIRVSKLKLRNFPRTGRGLAAEETIRSHEILLTIPPKYLINLKTVGKELGFDWRSPPVPAHVALAVYILHHKDILDSPLRSYIISLPSSFETVPLLWSEDIAELLPASSRSYLEKQQTVFEKHYAAAQEFAAQHLEATQARTLDRPAFQWAWLVVNSRCIYQELSPTSTRDDNYACSPLIDMINHVPSSVPHCKLSYDIKGLSVISQTSYRAGQETFISYGAHSNEALLCEYGFVIPNNTDNCIKIDELLAAVLQPCHQRLLMEMGYFEDYTISYHGEISFRTEVALRAALLSADDCVEGSTRCRHLTQFVNGHNSGARDQQDVDNLLKHILTKDLEHSHEALTRSKRSGSHSELIAQLWHDRIDILQLCLKHIR